MRDASARFNFTAIFLTHRFALADFDLDAIAVEEELCDGTQALNEQDGDALDEQDGDALDEQDGDALDEQDDDLASQSEDEEPANKRARNA